MDWIICGTCYTVLDWCMTIPFCKCRLKPFFDYRLSFLINDQDVLGKNLEKYVWCMDYNFSKYRKIAFL